jgi:hypothetical protein
VIGMAKSKLERLNPLLINRSEPVALATGPSGVSRLDPAQIRTDGGTQMRAGLNEETVVEYLELILEPNEWPFPPVIVFHDGEVHWLGDGFHRVEAARRYIQREQIGYTVVAEVRPGTRRDAVLCAAGANAAHGLRRTNADKRRAVETLLRDEEWGQWSNREIARRCAVSQPFVSKLRTDLIHTDNRYQYESDQRTFVHPKTGQPTSMNISGQRAQGAAAPKMRVPKGYTPPAAPASKPPLTLDETLSLIWAAIRDLVRSTDPADRLAWLASLPDDYGFYRDTPADRSLAPETLQTAKGQVIAELQGQLTQREERRRRRSLSADEGETTQAGPVESAPVGLEAANGALEQERTGQWLPAPSGRPRLPRARRVNQLVSLYQEVLATLDEYGRLVVDEVGAKHTEDALRVMTAMIAELEKEVGMAG